MPNKKIFVLDTNVILHEYNCIYKFGENDVVIPIAVLEELDRFKKGSESLNYHAREFVRVIDKLSGTKIFKTGVPIREEGKSKLLIQVGTPFHPDLSSSFESAKADHQILNCAYNLKLQHPSKKVILITKDVNLRMKAKAVGLLVEDYVTDQVRNIRPPQKTGIVFDSQPNLMIQELYKTGVCPSNQADLTEEPQNNQYIILKNSEKSILARYDKKNQQLIRVQNNRVSGIKPRNAEQSFSIDALLDEKIQLIALCGKAGTGKTLLALAAAIEQSANFKQIYIGRPIVPLSNQDIGFLPGDLNSKLGPYMQPLYDNLSVIKGETGWSGNDHERISKLENEERIKIVALSYIRGRTLAEDFVIIDEAQNLSPHEVKTIITRAGEGTKIVFCGDIYQIDHPYLDMRSNGLSYLIEKMKGESLFASITLEKGERSALAELASNIL
jgi:PhoH-like ATPase